MNLDIHDAVVMAVILSIVGGIMGIVMGIRRIRRGRKAASAAGRWQLAGG
jgi:hypothetical protein